MVIRINSFKHDLIKKRDFTEDSAYVYQKRMEALIDLENSIEYGDQEAILRALTKKIENNPSDSTAKGYLAAAKQYVLLNNGDIMDIPPPRQRPKKRRPPRILSSEELSIVRQYFKYEDEQMGPVISVRNKLLFEIPLYCPIRSKELLDLTAYSINLNKQTIKFRNREIILPKEIVETAAKYLYFRHGVQPYINVENALFLNHHHKALGAKGAQNVMKYICQKLGIKRFTLENIRETRIYHLLKMGLNEIEIGIFAGTVSYFKIQSMQRYLSNQETDKFLTAL